MIVAADVTGSGSEQAMLLLMIEQAGELRAEDTVITADAARGDVRQGRVAGGSGKSKRSKKAKP